MCDTSGTNPLKMYSVSTRVNCLSHAGQEGLGSPSEYATRASKTNARAQNRLSKDISFTRHERNMMEFGDSLQPCWV